MKKTNYYNKVLSVLQDLKKDYPNQTLGQHLGTALSDYSDLWPLSDSEIFHALEKYQFEQDNNMATDEDVKRILQEGLQIDNPQYWDDENEE